MQIAHGGHEADIALHGKRIPQIGDG